MRNALLALLLSAPAAAQSGSVCDRTLTRAESPVPRDLERKDAGRLGIVDYAFYAAKGETRITAVLASARHPDLGAISDKWSWERSGEVYVRREGMGAEKEPVCVRRVIKGMDLQGFYERMKPQLKR